MSARKPYIREMPKSWWLKNRFFTAYMVREGTSVFVAIYTAILMVGVLRLSQGPEAWNGWLEAMGNPLAVVFHLVALALACYHTYTWFAVTPKAMHVQLGAEKVPDRLIVMAHYGAAAVASLVVLFLAGWG